MDFWSSFLVRIGDGDRDWLDESLLADCGFFFGFLSLFDSDSDDEPDESEVEEEEFELDPDDDLSDGERVGFLFFCISLTGETIDLTLSIFDDVEVTFFIGGGGGEGDIVGDFRLDFDIDGSWRRSCSIIRLSGTSFFWSSLDEALLLRRFFSL